MILQNNLMRPEEVMIEITPQCNFSCSGCFNKVTFANDSRNINSMSTQDIKSIIDSCANANIERIRFTGGEPLLRNDLPKLIQYAYSKGLKVWLNTNATLVTKHFLKQTENYIDDVLISINGYDDDSDFNWTKTKNSFKKKLAGIKLLKQSNINYIRAGTVATPKNIEYLDKIYAVVKRLQFNNWEVYRPIPISSKNDDFFDVKLLLSKLKTLSHDYGKIIRIANIIPLCADSPEILSEYSFGGKFDEGHSKIHVDPAGFAKPSYFINYNIGDPRNILACWNNPFMQKMRSLTFLPKECSNCEYKQICKGGSRYISEIYTHKINSLDTLANVENVLSLKKQIGKISVIIPTFNNSFKLSYVLKALEFQTLPLHDFEVIIVDDGSTDNTFKIVENFKKTSQLMIHYLKQEGFEFRAGQARNKGGTFANGENLIFINDDIIPMPDLLQNYLNNLFEFDVCIGYTAAYGTKKEVYDNTIIYRAIDNGKADLQKIKILSEFRNDKFRQNNVTSTYDSSTLWKLFTATNFAIKKKVFLSELFDERFVGWGVEDEEFAYRLSKQFKLKMCEDAVALHLTHDNEDIVEFYTNAKIISMLNNFLIFFKLHPNDDIRDYILERYNHLPEQFKNKKLELKLNANLNLS